MRDPSYEAGYRDGHLQGWLDAMAKQHATLKDRTTAAPAAVPAPQSFPASEISFSLAPTDGVSSTAPDTFPATALRGVGPVPVAPAAVKPASGSQTRGEPATTPAFGVAGASVPPRPGSHGPAAGKAASFRAAPQESPAERQARREKRDRQNINITLYVASLMLVAAAALFIGTSLPPLSRFAGVCAVTALFYTSGLVLHAKVPRLKPAAVAFTGTGLAMVPVTGLALYNFVLAEAPAAWLITSLIGTAGYVAAAVRLESRVLVYLSLTFLASTAFSGVSVLGGALVWYFAALIGVAVLLTALALLRPGWLPPVYLRPLMVLHPIVVPAVAVAATFVPLLLDKGEYALVLGMCGSYFALMAAVPGRLKLLNFYGARAALTVAAAVGIWHLTDSGSDALLSAAVLFALQSMGVAFLSGRLNEWFPVGNLTPAVRRSRAQSGDRWMVDALITFCLLLLATAAFGALVVADRFDLGPGNNYTLHGPVPLWMPVALSLVTAMVLAVRWRGRAEGAPVAALVLAGAAAPVMGAWPLACMLLVTAGFWGVRAIYARGAFRGRLVLAARVVFTIAVPVTVAALTEDGPERIEASLLALLVALVCQQLLTAVLERRGAPTIMPQETLGLFGAGGVAALAAITTVDTSPDQGLTVFAVFLQLAVALAIGVLLVPRPVNERDWTATVYELLPPAISVVAVGIAFQSVSQGAGNAALVLVVAYLLVVAGRLPMRQHRWAYWWLSRAAATVLALTVFHQLQQVGPPLMVADEVLHPATVLVTVLALQLCLPLVAAARRRAPRRILADPGAVLLVQFGCCAALAQAPAAGWQGIWAAGLASAGAAAAGYFLRSEAGSQWFAPAALLFLLANSRGELLEVELLLGVFAAYSALMVVAEPQYHRKGWYFVAARVLTAALALVLSYDLSASPTVVSLTFAVVLAAQHLVRWLMRARLSEIPFQQAAVWITLAGQAVLPLVYATEPRAAGLLGQDDDGGRWVVVLELLMLLVSAVVARKYFSARGALYFAVYAVLFGVLALGPLISYGPSSSGGTFMAMPVLSHTGTAAVLLSLALLAAAAGVVRRGRNVGRQDPEHWLWLVSAGASAVAGLVIAPLAADWVTGAAVLVLATIGFIASHVEDQPLLYPPAALTAVADGLVLATPAYAEMSGAWGGFLPWLTGAGAASAALYLLRLYRSDSLQGDPVRRWSLAGATLLGLVLVVLAGGRQDATAWPAAAVLALAVLIAYLEAPDNVRRPVLEAGAVAMTMAVQRAAIFELDGRAQGYGSVTGMPDPFWVVQWYVVLAAALGVLRYLSRSRSAGHFLVGAASVLLSLSGVGVVFGGDGGKQLWVLILLALLLVAGLGLGERLFVWWGAAGVAACILWAMRNYTFLLLAVIAAGLIVFAVWRLNRGAAGNPPGASEVHPDAPDGTHPAEQGTRPAGPDTVAGTERSSSWNG